MTMLEKVANLFYEDAIKEKEEENFKAKVFNENSTEEEIEEAKARFKEAKKRYFDFIGC